MKKITLTLLALLSVVLLFAQSPQSFKYQAVARDNAGIIINNQLVSFRISILQGSATGTSMYSETHQPTTNDFGLANLEIGSGSIVSGNFTTIDWSLGSYFLKIEMDANGGSSYQLMGASQLLSVPYALFAENTTNPGDDDWTISGDDMYSTVPGNVGIGTTTPSAMLDVAGHISVSNTGNSVFLGRYAGINDDLSSNYNTFIGYDAGVSNFTGDYNCAYGAYALLSNNDGFGNSAIGVSSLEENTTGYDNSALGYYALASNSTGSGNNAIGHNALRGCISGSNNTVIGNNAGYLSTGSGNIYLGSQAGYNNTTSNKLFIDNSSTSTPLIYGEFDNDMVAINGSLDVAGHISTSNTGASVFLGFGAGFNDDLSNNFNAFIGHLTGYFNTTGNNNTALGCYSFFVNEGGAYNTVVGYESLYYNVSGNNNTAIGYKAGHGSIGTSVDGCVYLGNESGYYNGTDNRLFIENSNSNSPLIYGEFDNDILAINGKLGVGTHTPAVNLHVVNGSGANLSSGGFIVSGSTTGANIVIDDNEIMARLNGGISPLYMQKSGGVFWLHSSLSEIYEFVVATDGKTGIGENAPDSKLNINSSTLENALRVEVNGVTKLLVNSNGGVALYNASTPAFALELQNSSADLYGRARAYSWNTYSDNRLKSNQRNIEYGLKEVLQLQPKSYDHHSSSTNEEGEFIMVTNQKEATVGFIAQEVEKIIPEAVCVPQNDAKDLWSMDYDKLIPVLTKAIQEQQEIIEEQQDTMQELLSRIEALENQ